MSNLIKSDWRDSMEELRKEDLRVDIDGSMLVISGEKKSERSERKGKMHISECSYGSFSRAVPCPARWTATRQRRSTAAACCGLTCPGFRDLKRKNWRSPGRTEHGKDTSAHPKRGTGG